MTRFYENQEDFLSLVRQYTDSILPMKRSTHPLFSNYEVFSYEEKEMQFPIEVDGASDATVVEELRSMFQNAVNWDCTSVQYNVHPNVALHAHIAPFLAGFANPNFAQDISSGGLMLAERAVVRYLLTLADWQNHGSGIFTFGGKGSNLYAGRLALEAAQPDLRRKGVRGDYVFLSTDVGHPCHIEICNWLGVGEDNCIRLETQGGMLAPATLKGALKGLYSDGRTPVMLTLSGLSTNNHSVDDFRALNEVLAEVASDYGADKPWLHVDAVLGWVYLLTLGYNFGEVRSQLRQDAITLVKRKAEAMSHIGVADSFGVDFHKTGFVGYSSSVFLTRHAGRLHAIEDHYAESPLLRFSEYSPYSYTLELSRSAHGAVGAWAALRSLGTGEYCRILVSMTEGYLELKSLFAKDSRFQVLNLGEDSNLLFLTLLPPTLSHVDGGLTGEEASRIREMNSTFYRFYVRQHELGKGRLLFSASRSYIFAEHKLGAFKIYGFNSRFDTRAAREFYTEFIRLYEAYCESPEAGGHFGVFEFLEVKGNR